MNPEKIWKGFFVFLVAVALWFTAHALYLVVSYYTLDSTTRTRRIEWSVREKSSEFFIIEGNYHYQVNGEDYSGISGMNDERFRNEWAAKDALKKEPHPEVTVWYSSWYYKHSSLQKTFPIKECVSALVLWALFIYFFRLKQYVAKKMSEIRGS